MINEKHEQHLRKDQLRSSLNSHDDNVSPSSDGTTTPENVYAIPDDIPLEFGDGISDVIAELPPLISYNENLVLPHEEAPPVLPAQTNQEAQDRVNLMQKKDEILDKPLLELTKGEFSFLMDEFLSSLTSHASPE